MLNLTVIKVFEISEIKNLGLDKGPPKGLKISKGGPRKNRNFYFYFQNFKSQFFSAESQLSEELYII
jgi:hypothetical protein